MIFFWCDCWTCTGALDTYAEAETVASRRSNWRFNLPILVRDLFDSPTTSMTPLKSMCTEPPAIVLDTKVPVGTLSMQNLTSPTPAKVDINVSISSSAMLSDGHTNTPVLKQSLTHIEIYSERFCLLNCVIYQVFAFICDSSRRIL